MRLHERRTIGYTCSMPKIAIADQILFYTYRNGPAGAPAALLIHGAAGTHLDWPAQFRRLPNAAVYALDLPGHGRSAPPGRESVDAYADIVQAFLEQLALTDVIVIGHSMGGAIAQVLALRHLPHLSGLVLLGTGARLHVNESLLNRPPSEFSEVVDFITKYAWSADPPTALIDTARDLLHANDPAVVHGDFVACNRFDVTERVGHITLPTLVIGGSADRMVPLTNSHYLANQIPHAHLVTVAGGSHMMALEQPDRVASAVQQFVAELSEH